MLPATCALPSVFLSYFLFLACAALIERFTSLTVKEPGSSPYLGKPQTFRDFSIFFFFLFLATEFQRTSNSHLHLRTYFVGHGNWAQGFRCGLCHTVGGFASGGKNLERQREPPCAYHTLNTAQLLKPMEDGQGEKAGMWGKRREVIWLLFSNPVCSLDLLFT